MSDKSQLAEDVAAALRPRPHPEMPDFEAAGAAVTGSFIAGYVEGLGWRPPARTVTTVEELDALAVGTVIRSALGTVMEEWQDGSWRPTGMHNAWPRVELPATVLWEPSE